MELQLFVTVLVIFAIFFAGKLITIFKKRGQNKKLEFLTILDTKVFNDSTLMLYYEKNNTYVYLKEINQQKSLIIQNTKPLDKFIISTYSVKRKLISKIVIENSNQAEAMEIIINKMVEYLTVEESFVENNKKSLLFKFSKVIIDVGTVITFLLVLFFSVGIYKTGYYFKYFYNNVINNYLIIYLIIIGILTMIISYRINTEYQEVIYE